MHTDTSHCKFDIFGGSFRSISDTKPKTHDTISIVLFCGYCGRYIIRRFDIYKERNMNNEEKSIQDIIDYEKQMEIEAKKKQKELLESELNSMEEKENKEEYKEDKNI